MESSSYVFHLRGPGYFHFHFGESGQFGQSDPNTGFSLEVRTVLSLLSHYFLIVAFLSLNER